MLNFFVEVKITIRILNRVDLDQEMDSRQFDKTQ